MHNRDRLNRAKNWPRADREMDKKVGVMVGRVGSIQWHYGGPIEGKRRGDIKGGQGVGQKCGQRS